MKYCYECDKCGSSKHVTHRMSEDPEIKCDKCNNICYRAIQPVEGFTKGSGYLNKAECKKHAELHTLKEADPYGKHRQVGEVDDLISKMKNSHKNKKTFMMDPKDNKPNKK